MLQWIKGSERIPPNGKTHDTLNIKYKGRADTLVFIEHDGNQWNFNKYYTDAVHKKVSKEDWKYIEWLDESCQNEVYAIHQGCIWEGGGVSEIYGDKEKAIKFALIELEEQKKLSESMWRHHPEGKERFTWKEKVMEENEDIVRSWDNGVNEIVIYKHKLL